MGGAGRVAWGGTGVSSVNRWGRPLTRRMRILTRGHDTGPGAAHRGRRGAGGVGRHGGVGCDMLGAAGDTADAYFNAGTRYGAGGGARGRRGAGGVGRHGGVVGEPLGAAGETVGSNFNAWRP